MRRKLDLQADDRLPEATALSFGIARLEIFLSFIDGACLILVSRDTTADGLA
jgi:Co/Zn/Cd efflux system component